MDGAFTTFVVQSMSCADALGAQALVLSNGASLSVDNTVTRCLSAALVMGAVTVQSQATLTINALNALPISATSALVDCATLATGAGVTWSVGTLQLTQSCSSVQVSAQVSCMPAVVAC